MTQKQSAENSRKHAQNPLIWLVCYVIRYIMTYVNQVQKQLIHCTPLPTRSKPRTQHLLESLVRFTIARGGRHEKSR